MTTSQITFDFPDSVFVNTNTNFDIQYSVISGIGFGPAYDLIVPPNVTLTIDGNPTPYAIWNSFSSNWSNPYYPTYGSPIPTNLTLPNGSKLYHVVLPYSAYGPTQPVLTSTYSMYVNVGSGTITDSIPTNQIIARSMFLLGTNATYDPPADPIYSPINTSAIPLARYSFEKFHGTTVGVGNPTGPSYPINYTARLQIAPQQTVNSLSFFDPLDKSMRYVSHSVNVTNFIGSSASTFQLISQPTHQELQLSMDQTNITGAPSSPITTIDFNYSVYVDYYDYNTNNYVLNPTNPPDILQINNTASVLSNNVQFDSDTDTVQVSPSTIEKTSELWDITTNQPVTGSQPIACSYIKNTLNVYISDYFSYTNYELYDDISAGQLFVDNTANVVGKPTNPFVREVTSIAIDGISNGTTNNISTSITPISGCTVDPSAVPSWYSSDGSLELQNIAPNITTYLYNVAPLLFPYPKLTRNKITIPGTYRGYVYNLEVTTPGIPNPILPIETNPANPVQTSLTVVYYTIAQARYIHPLVAPQPNNFVEIQGELNNNVGLLGKSISPLDGVLQITNASSVEASIVLPSVTLTKSVYAINGIVGSYLTVNPGDIITYKVDMYLPSTNLSSLIFTDYLPIPIMDVAPLLLSLLPYSPLLPSNRVMYGPSGFPPGTGPIGGGPVVTMNTTDNSFTINFGRIENNTGIDNPVTVELLFSFPVSNTAFVDGLLFTNQARIQIENNISETNDINSFAPITLNEPNLQIKKLIYDLDTPIPTNPNITIEYYPDNNDPPYYGAGTSIVAVPPQTITDYDNYVPTDAINVMGDTIIRYVLLIANKGHYPATEITLSDVFDNSNVSNVVIVGAYLNTGFEFLNFPVNTSIVSNIRTISIIFDNGAGFISLDPDQFVSIVYDVYLNSSTPLCYTHTNSARITEFKNINSSGNFIDAFGNLTGTTASINAYSSTIGISINNIVVNPTINIVPLCATTLTIGQWINFDLNIFVPRGTLNDLSINFNNFQDFKYTLFPFITPSGTTVFIPEILTSAFSAAIGDIIAANGPEQYIANMRIKIPNIPAIVDGNTYLIGSSIGSSNCYGTYALNFCISEPSVTISKTSTQISSTRIRYTVILENNNVNDAFNIDFIDDLPIGLINWDPSSVTTNYIGTYTDLSDNNIINLQFDSLPINGSITIEFEGIIDPTNFIIGYNLHNVAEVKWYSLPFDRTSPNPRDPDIREYSANAPNDYSYGSPDICCSLSNITYSHPEVSSIIPVGAIGDLMRYRFTISINQGTLVAKKLKLFVPTSGLSLTSGTTEVPIRSSTNLSFLPGQPIALENDGICMTFTQNLINSSNTLETYIIDVILRISNSSANVSGTTYNSSLLQLQYSENIFEILTPNCLPSFTVVEPSLTITKSFVEYISVGTRKLSYNLIITNASSQYTSDAYQLKIEDGNFVNPNQFSSISVSGPGTITTINNNLVALLPILSPGQSVTYLVDAFLANGFPNSLQIFENTASISYYSQSSGVPNNAIYARDGSDKTSGINNYYSESNVEVELQPYSLTKTANQTNINVGDTIEYTLTFSIPIGTHTNFTLVDVLDSNFTMDTFTLISTDIGLAGYNFDIFNNTITFDLGIYVLIPNSSIKYWTFVLTSNSTFTIKYSLRLASKLNSDTANENNVTLYSDVTELLNDECVVNVIEPNLYLDKSIETDGPYSTDQLVTYQLNIGHTNLSTVDAYNLVITDTPLNFGIVEEIDIFTSSPQTNVTFLSTVPNSSLQANFDRLPLNSIIKITYKVKMQNTSSGPQPNIATVNYTNVQNITYPQITDSEVLIIGDPVPKVSKTPDKYTFIPGDTITWKIEYTNTGNSPGYLPTLTEIIPVAWLPYITVLSVDWTNVSPGTYQYNSVQTIVRPNEIYDAYFIFKINNDTILTTLDNTVQFIFSNATDVSSDVETIQTFAQPLLTLTKTLTNGPLRFGYLAIYNITVKNIGNLAIVIDSGLIVDTAPDLIIFNPNEFFSATLAPGQEYTYDVEGIVLIDNGLLTNSIAADLIHGTTNTHLEANVVTPVVQPELIINKEILTPGPYKAGNYVTYRITVEHMDTSTFSAANVNIFDNITFGQIDLNSLSIVTLPNNYPYTNTSNSNNLIISVPNIELGSSMIIDVNVLLNNDVYGTIDNNASINWTVDTMPSQIYTDSDLVSLNIGNPAAIISKTPDIYTVTLDDIVTWTIYYKNTGYSIGYNSVITEDISAYPWLQFIPTPGWILVNPGVYSYSLGDLLPDQEGTILFKTKVIGPIPENTENITNIAVLLMSSFNGDPFEISASAEAMLIVDSFASSNLTKVLTAGEPIYGENITYTICTTNNGTEQLNAPLTVVDTLPLGTVLVPGQSSFPAGYTLVGQELTFVISPNPLNPGESACSTITLNIQNNATSPIINSALLFNSNNQNIGNAQTSHIIKDPVLYIDKSIITQYPVAGGLVTYRIEVGHEINSTSNAYNLSIIDNPPATTTLIGTPIVTFVPPDSLQPLVVDTSSGNLSIQFPDLPLDVTMYIEYQMQIDNLATGSLTNTATLTYTRLNDPTPIVETDDATFLLNTHNLDLTKNVDKKTFKTGDIVEWQLEYENKGNVTETNVHLDEPSLPSWMVFVPQLSQGWYQQGTAYRYDIGNILPGITNTINYYVQIVGPIPDNFTYYTNIGTITSDLTTSTDNETIMYRPEIKLIIKKKLIRYNKKCGNAMFEFVIMNDGLDVVSGNYKIVENIPDNFRPDFELKKWTYDLVNNTATYDLPNFYLKPGDYVIIKLELVIINCNVDYVNKVSLLDNINRIIATDLLIYKADKKNLCMKQI